MCLTHASSRSSIDRHMMIRQPINMFLNRSFYRFHYQIRHHKLTQVPATQSSLGLHLILAPLLPSEAEETRLGQHTDF